MSEMRQIAEKINNADAVLIGASNGLSITEGIHLFANNQAYQELFGDYQKKYGLVFTYNDSEKYDIPHLFDIFSWL